MPNVPSISLLKRLGLVAVAALVLAAPAGTALSAPTPATPEAGAALETLPAFAWNSVAGADRYEFEIAADAGFNSPVLGMGLDHFTTRNTRATLKKTIPNGTYWWRVRGVSATGSPGPWSPGRSFVKAWNTRPVPLWPIAGEQVTHPTVPLRLEWTAVPRAREYLVSVATDASLASLVGGSATKTEATTLTLPRLLAEGTYYWGVTPLDAAGNRGAPSVVASFNWTWPSTTTPRVTDLLPEYDNVFDPQFSWNPVPGAVRYEVEVFSADQPDLKVCCAGTTLTNTLSPTVVFKDNLYYWRVRALDAASNAGRWNDGPEFTKAFAAGLPSVQNLRMRDHTSDPGIDIAPGLQGYQTEVPVVAWDPVPGASSYQVEVTPYDAGAGLCNWTAPRSVRWQSTTATTAWTPLGDRWSGNSPYLDRPNVANDTLTALVPNTAYCVRVRPRDVDSTLLGGFVYGSYTYLEAQDEPAFVWTGYPAGGPCMAPCTPNYLGRGDYLLPARGVTTGRMPLFTWKPIAGKQSYFVIVAKDPNFLTIEDYAFTQVPAYAPRTGFGPTAYEDETTTYYWVVLPAAEHSGNGAVGDPLAGASASFQKLSAPPDLVAPATAAVEAGRPVFRWRPVEGARRYRLQVSRDASFAGCGALVSGNCLENIVTDSTGYASATTYPSDTQVYWRVRGEDELAQALPWSVTGSFVSRLPVPVLSESNPTSGDFLPTMSWGAVQGAVSYDLEVDQPDGRHVSLAGYQGAAFAPALLWGTGIWKFRVRARFAKALAGMTEAGPWTRLVGFTRTIREPGGPETSAGPGPHVVLSWLPQQTGRGNGIREYKVQISNRPDFSTVFEEQRTDNTSFASQLVHYAYSVGGTFYWRVAAMDGSGINTGDFTAPQSFTLAAGTAVKQATTLTVSISKTRRALRAKGRLSPAHPGARVAVSLYRKRSGSFVRLAVKRPMLSHTGTYATSFARPRRGTCKVTARFSGDADHRASTRSVKFRC